MSMPKRLLRRSSSGRVAGVCSGMAEYMDTDVTLIRLLWVLLSIVPGAFIGGVIAYLFAWVIMPDATDPAVVPVTQHLTRSTRDRKVAGVCGGLADYFNIDATVVRVLWAVLSVVPGSLVFGVVAYLVAWFIMPSAGGLHPSLAHDAA